jgi:hypothetical protein
MSDAGELLSGHHQRIQLNLQSLVNQKPAIQIFTII